MAWIHGGAMERIQWIKCSGGKMIAGAFTKDFLSVEMLAQKPDHIAVC
jgi:hypothetical protein